MVDALAIWCVKLGLPEEMFWTVTPRLFMRFSDEYEEKERSAYLRAGVLTAAIYNVNRDPKKSRALTPQDIYPFLREALREDDSQRLSVDDVKKLMPQVFTVKGKK